MLPSLSCLRRQIPAVPQRPNCVETTLVDLQGQRTACNPTPGPARPPFLVSRLPLGRFHHGIANNLFIVHGYQGLMTLAIKKSTSICSPKMRSDSVAWGVLLACVAGPLLLSVATCHLDGGKACVQKADTSILTMLPRQRKAECLHRHWASFVCGRPSFFACHSHLAPDGAQDSCSGSYGARFSYSRLRVRSRLKGLIKHPEPYLPRPSAFWTLSRGRGLAATCYWPGLRPLTAKESLKGVDLCSGSVVQGPATPKPLVPEGSSGRPASDLHLCTTFRPRSFPLKLPTKTQLEICSPCRNTCPTTQDEPFELPVER